MSAWVDSELLDDVLLLADVDKDDELLLNELLDELVEELTDDDTEDELALMEVELDETELLLSELLDRLVELLLVDVLLELCPAERTTNTAGSSSSDRTR